MVVAAIGLGCARAHITYAVVCVDIAVLESDHVSAWAWVRSYVDLGPDWKPCKFFTTV